MLDVHPPHTPVHGWRDFLLHLATITIGLLIAISLEQTVEFFHHRHLVKEAHEQIRAEIEANEHKARMNMTSVQLDASNMKHNMELVHRSLADPHVFDHGEMHFNFAWSGFGSSAWRSARDTGALTFMPPAEVQLYSDLYTQQQIVSDNAVAIFTRQSDIFASILAYDGPDKLPPADAHTLMIDCATAAVRLDTLTQFIKGLDTEYQDALKH